MDAVLLTALAVGFYMAWNIGANDSAKAVGTAVGSNILSFKQAIFLIALFTLLGAFLGGNNVARTVGQGIIPTINAKHVILILLSAGVSITIATLRGLPTSTTQSILGAILGVGIYQKTAINWLIVEKIVLAWILSPLVAALFSIALLEMYGKIINKLSSMRTIEILYRWMAVLSATYASFNLGANELSNVIGLLAYTLPIKISILKLIAAFGLSVGALTFSYEVIMTVGKKLILMDPLTAFASQFGSSIAVSLANAFGLPVSSGQAIIGGVIGVGIAKGQKINKKLVVDIVKSWILAPLFSFTLTIVLLTILGTAI